MDAGFPQEHFEESLDLNAMTTREMLEKQNQNRNDIMEKLGNEKHEEQ